MQLISLTLFVYQRHTLILASTLSDDSTFEILDHPSNNNWGGSRTAATPKMERFVTIVNGWKPLTIITKHSILDVWAALDQSLNKRGGVCIYYKSFLPLRILNVHYLQESVCFELKIGDNTCNFLSLYRSQAKVPQAKSKMTLKLLLKTLN